MAKVVIEIQTELDIDKAIEEFEQNCTYSFKSTENCQVTDTYWSETDRISVRELNKTETQMLIKPLKNVTKPIDGY